MKSELRNNPVKNEVQGSAEKTDIWITTWDKSEYKISHTVFYIPYHMVHILTLVFLKSRLTGTTHL